MRYRYRGVDPEHRDNLGLREAMRGEVPLVYFHAVAKGKYLAVWPVYVVGDDPGALTFSVAVDDAELALSLLKRLGGEGEIAEYDSTSRRRYVTGLVRLRLHQRTFRERVLRAYRRQCALCRLRHAALLDAAHIIQDKEELGEPRVPNGISLCKLHHAAFDAFFLAIGPDYRIEVKTRILEEEDGPMLVHGLQELHHQRNRRRISSWEGHPAWLDIVVAGLGLAPTVDLVEDVLPGCVVRQPLDELGHLLLQVFMLLVGGVSLQEDPSGTGTPLAGAVGSVPSQKERRASVAAS